MRSRERYASARWARRFDRLRRYQLDTDAIRQRLDAVRPLHGARVVELGAGTGVLTERLAEHAGSLVALDRSPAMLELARHRLASGARLALALAEHRTLPLASGCADLVVAAFSLDSVVYGSDETSWRAELGRTLRELARLVAAGGAVAIVASPHGARGLGAELERVHGFQRRFFRTTWRFPSRREARAAVELFFSRHVWRGYRSEWPKDLVTLAGIWWR
jgi:ubiquinone/menaquinone biosynthesis C-methylase UbiE